jgi:probable rRNA maturation factor
VTLARQNFAKPMVEVINAARAPTPGARIRAAVAAAAGVPEVSARLPVADWEIAVRVSGDRELRRLNRQFLGEDHVTDVLSFPSGETAGHLGDVVLSWPAVRRQAAEFGHDPEAELMLLTVHGFLHVLGWDHASLEEEAEMTRLTLNALGALGVRLAPGRLLKEPPPG